MLIDLDEGKIKTLTFKDGDSEEQKEEFFQIENKKILKSGAEMHFVMTRNITCYSIFKPA